MNAAPLRIITFGCRLNAFESEIMRERLGSGAGDVIVVNTCTVTAEAGRQARQAIRRARRENPTARIVVTGCAAQIDPEVFAAMPEVDRVVGNAAKLDPASLLADDGARVSVADVMADPAAVPEAPLGGLGADSGAGFEGRARAFVQIQQGCDHRCTFCIVPFARGPSRSVPAPAVAEQARRLVAAGFNEIVLTGIDISSYGRDLADAPTLGVLVRDLLKAVPELKRLRLSSLDPAVMDEALFGALAEEDRLMPHLHLSLQSLDDMVLKRMKRRHDRQGALAFVARARAARPGVSFGADLIAGFPTETDGMFQNTMAGVAEAGVSFLHVFPYSPRPGTPAVKMPQVPERARSDRAARLRDAGEAALARFLATRVGATADVLVEKNGFGRAPDHAPVRLSFAAPEGAVIAARLVAVTDGALIGDRS